MNGPDSFVNAAPSKRPMKYLPDPSHSTHFLFCGLPSTGSSKMSGHSNSPAKRDCLVQCFRSGEVWKTIPCPEIEKTITQCFVCSCQKTRGSRSQSSCLGGVPGQGRT